MNYELDSTMYNGKYIQTKEQYYNHLKSSANALDICLECIAISVPAITKPPTTKLAPIVSGAAANR